MNPSPEICVECGHRFSPGAPEPSWCPDCGRLCSASDEPEERTEEIEEFGTPVLGRIFWIIFLGTTVVAVVAMLLPPTWTLGFTAKLGLPAIIRPSALPMMVALAQGSSGGLWAGPISCLNLASLAPLR